MLNSWLRGGGHRERRRDNCNSINRKEGKEGREGGREEGKKKGRKERTNEGRKEGKKGGTRVSGEQPPLGEPGSRPCRSPAYS